MKTSLNVEVGAIKNALALHRRDDVDFEELADEVELELEVNIDALDAQDIAAAAGYVDADQAHEDALASIDPQLWDLRDGLKALMAGDTSMAMVLLDRAFDNWPDARRAVEDALRGRTAADPRQLRLAA